MTEQVQDDVIGDLYEEDESVEEAMGHDEKNAEEKSVKSVKSAENAGKTAPARKGDQKKKDPMQKLQSSDPASKMRDAGAQPTEAYKIPKTKDAMMNDMYTRMQGFNKEDLTAMYSKFMAEDIEDDEAVEATSAQDAREADYYANDAISRRLKRSQGKGQPTEEAEEARLTKVKEAEQAVEQAGEQVHLFHFVGCVAQTHDKLGEGEEDVQKIESNGDARHVLQERGRCSEEVEGQVKVGG